MCSACSGSYESDDTPLDELTPEDFEEEEGSLLQAGTLER